jgi:hypothetical protein
LAKTIPLHHISRDDRVVGIRSTIDSPRLSKNQAAEIESQHFTIFLLPSFLLLTSTKLKTAGTVAANSGHA